MGKKGGNCDLVSNSGGLHQESNANLWVGVWPMFIGDTLGALLMLYGLKLLLFRLHIKQV